MCTKLFIAAALAGLVAGSTAFADTITKAKPTAAPKQVKTAQCNIECQLCCGPDCCEECTLCCSLDGCCQECIQCCIEMGCDPSCCFPSLTSANLKAPPQKGEACCTKPAQKAAKSCCGNGCCK